MPPEEWWERCIEHHRIDVLDLSASIVMRATRLPDIHRDPADRFIISSALEFDCSVVTADRRFTEYGVRILT
jgi:PIN domain nuclease of toxin-antitoxin system